MEDGLFDLSDHNQMEDEAFGALPPPLSPGHNQGDLSANGDENGEMSKLGDVPEAKRKGVKRPQPKLDANRLISDRGLPALRTLFNNNDFKGKGHEDEDLRRLMKMMENWAHRLFPKLQFGDFIDKVERLGSKKEVQTCMKRIRLDMPLTDEDFVSKDGEEQLPPEEQIFGDPDPFREEHFNNSTPSLVYSTPAPSARSPPSSPPTLTEEQRQRMEMNRLKALERRLARQQQTDSQPVPVEESTSASAETAPRNSQSLDHVPDFDVEPLDSSTQQQDQPLSHDSEAPVESTRAEKPQTSPSPGPSPDHEPGDDCKEEE